jgi:hypothetical protein
LRKVTSTAEHEERVTGDSQAELAKRVAVAVSCRDADYIPKVPDAGKVILTAQGERVQIMHNGVQVLVDAYYGPFHTDIIAALRGHHEPQEERVFHEVLQRIKSPGVMIELGSYWSYYSLWFQAAVAGAINYMVEPVEEHLQIGSRNFQINQRSGHFRKALVGSADRDDTVPETITVDRLIEDERLGRIDVLHSDIQGHEHAMLQGAQKAFVDRRIRFVFLSTHGGRVHSRCLGFLRVHRYHIIAEHTPFESYTVDGLIAAAADGEIGKVKISRRCTAVADLLRSILCRWFARFVH